MLSDECAPFDITTSAVDNISAADQVPTQTFGIFGSDARDTVFDDAVVTYVLRHDRRDAYRDIVCSVQLATERPSLDIASAALTDVTESGVLPAGRSLTD